MPRSDSAKQRLKKEAEQKIAGMDGVQLAPDETTAAGDLKYQRFPNVRGVVVDRSSETGYVQISSRDNGITKITTGPGESGFQYEPILEGQSCMLYGCPTVWWIEPCP
ncbi:hypothetical protein QBC36DRAFT_120906 [Triangularia setosa]|uniref:Uncharacterized protein n=1 Tax=Triangularia setosa TaxID=2587417 RepID=A0AAN6VZ65_9PEZI|nr:hypothetical protein QBC36DRAFT_120906 [Podospora setosa]